MRNLCLLLVCVVTALMACGPQSTTVANSHVSPSVRPRAIYVLLDVTPSYKTSRPAAVSKILETVKALGPADRFYLIEIGGEFSPEKRVKIQCRMPAIDPQVLQPTRLPSIWRDRRRRLDDVWRRTAEIQRQIEDYLARPWQDLNPTPLFETLRYASTRLAGEMDADRYIYVFSDFEQDSHGVKSLMPPRGEAYPVPGVEVFALFVPWGRSWVHRKAAWTDWYVKSCHATHFTVLDGAEAKVSLLLTPNKTPRSIALL